MGKEIEVVEDEKRKRPWEIWHLQSDNTKLYSVIDYRPATPFAKGLIKTIEDYKQNGWIYKPTNN
jgi:nucleoside-diphosphate-sugar epimerase